MKAERIIVSAFCAVLMAGCTHEIDAPVDVTRIVHVDASIADASRTTYVGGGKVEWEAGDVVRYYSDAGTVGSFTIGQSGPNAALEAVVGGSDTFLVAVYGGTGLSSCSRDGFVVEGAVSAEQSGVLGDGHVAVARTEDLSDGVDVSFGNITSFISFTVDRKDVRRVVFKAAAGEIIQSEGRIAVTFVDGEPVGEFKGHGGSSISVAIDGPGTYYIATLPVELPYGFSVKLFDSANEYLGVAYTESALTLGRSEILNLGVLDARVNPADGAEVRSLVSVPEVYMGGIPAAMYRYATGTALDFGTDEARYVDQLGNECYLASDAGVATACAHVTEGRGQVSVSRVNEFRYDVNPAAYRLDPLERWSLSAREEEYVTRSGGPAWRPEIMGIRKASDDQGKAVVSYVIENPDALEKAAGVPCVALDCVSIHEDVHSDFMALASVKESFAAVTFNCQTLDEASRPACGRSGLRPHLYQSAGEAIVNEPSLKVRYYGAPVDLCSMMTVHMATNGGSEYEMPLSKLQEVYPGVLVRFTNVTYIAGQNSSEQNRYCILGEESGIFQPGFPTMTGSGQWVVSPCQEGNPDLGMSAVGRQPVVLVTLVNLAGRGETLAAGYFKVMIVE